MSAFAVTPIFTLTQAIWFGVLLVLGVAVQFAFSPKRRAVMGSLRFILADVFRTAPAIAGVTLIRGAYRAGYLAEGRGFFEANLRSVVWMSGFIFVTQLLVRYLPPLSWLARDLRDAGRAVWSARLGRWMGRAA
ncbi:MAG: hypothetical protein EON87_19830 [Brevundimonas sp.]|nr:MAG: hypothetical protein EON87_19830 [Brevundimonas sp.]